MWHIMPLDGLGLNREKALELINRMNKHWPGKYILEWQEPPYSNNAINPVMTEYHSQANPLLHC